MNESPPPRPKRRPVDKTVVAGASAAVAGGAAAAIGHTVTSNIKKQMHDRIKSKKNMEVVSKAIKKHSIDFGKKLVENYERRYSKHVLPKITARTNKYTLLTRAGLATLGIGTTVSVGKAGHNYFTGYKPTTRETPK